MVNVDCKRLELIMRKIKFATDSYYHVFNRGIDKRKIFMAASARSDLVASEFPDKIF